MFDKDNYDSEGRLTYMIDREGVVTEIEYDSLHGKISRFTKSFPKPKDKRHVLSFQYDAQGHLITAEGSDGRRAVVSYFPNGMINELKAGKWIVHYTYNDQNKPIRIAVKGLGACRFLYSRTSGNYTVKPKSGSTKILEAVNSAFEVLSGIVDETFINYSLY